MNGQEAPRMLFHSPSRAFEEAQDRDRPTPKYIAARAPFESAIWFSWLTGWKAGSLCFYAQQRDWQRHTKQNRCVARRFSRANSKTPTPPRSQMHSSLNPLHSAKAEQSLAEHFQGFTKHPTFPRVVFTQHRPVLKVVIMREKRLPLPPRALPVLHVTRPSER